MCKSDPCGLPVLPYGSRLTLFRPRVFILLLCYRTQIILICVRNLGEFTCGFKLSNLLMV